MTTRKALASAALALAVAACAAAALAAEPPAGGKQSQLVSVNGASAQELEGVLGVGPALAERIIKYRAAHGPFKTLDDLLLVNGIGEAKLKRLSEQLRL